MVTRFEIATKRGLRDARGEHAAAQVRDFLHLPVESVRTREVYKVEGELSADEAARVLHELTDPVLHEGAIGRECELTQGLTVESTHDGSPLAIAHCFGVRAVAQVYGVVMLTFPRLDEAALSDLEAFFSAAARRLART